MDNTGTVLVVGGVALLAWAFLSRGNGEPPPGNGGGNGTPPGGVGLVLENVLGFSAIAFNNGPNVVVGPGQVLDIGAETLEVHTSNLIRVRNTAVGVTKFLNVFMELRKPLNNFPDLVWLRYSPGIGVRKVSSTVGPLTVRSNPPTGAGIGILPGSAITFDARLKMSGPGFDQASSLFWADEAAVENEKAFDLAYKLEIFDMDSRNATAGRRLTSLSWTPAFKVKVGTVLAQAAMGWASVPFNQDTRVDFLRFPSGQMMQLPTPATVGSLLAEVGTELNRAEMTVMQYGGPF